METKLRYMDTDSFVVCIKADDIYKDTAEDVEKRFDHLNLELDRPSPERNNIKVIGLIKDELGEKKGNSSEDRKEKGHKNKI